MPRANGVVDRARTGGHGRAATAGRRERRARKRLRGQGAHRLTPARGSPSPSPSPSLNSFRSSLEHQATIPHRSFRAEGPKAYSPGRRPQAWVGWRKRRALKGRHPTHSPRPGASPAPSPSALPARSPYSPRKTLRSTNAGPAPVPPPSSSSSSRYPAS